MKLGREQREGLGRVDTVAREKRNALVHFRLTATFCERCLLGINYSSDPKRKDCKQSNPLQTLWNMRAQICQYLQRKVCPGANRLHMRWIFVLILKSTRNRNLAWHRGKGPSLVCTRRHKILKSGLVSFLLSPGERRTKKYRKIPLISYPAYKPSRL